MIEPHAATLLTAQAFAHPFAGVSVPTERDQTAEIRVTLGCRRWAIEVQDGAGSRRVPLCESPVTVGSGRGVTIVVHDATVSARHCEVAAVGDRVVVRDLGSRNGTYVGGARVQEAWASEGTVVAIGQTTLVCVAVGDLDERDPSVDQTTPLPGLVGESLVMRRLAAQVRRLAMLSSPVLIAGETGVGKELIARALHTEGARGAERFVALNVAALPRELVESELFGHERGAFTGAVAKRQGAFTEAEGGTLFLDEIGELPLDAQPKLLRALDGYEVRRVGGAGSGRKANARVVVATHVALLDHVARGMFRRDLYHRLEVFVVEVPPLRERPGDIWPIARGFLRALERELGARELTPAAIARLSAYAWPGNVRELRNVLCRAADLSTDERWIDASAIDRAMRRAPEQMNVQLTLQAARECMAREGGNVSAAARAAGVPRTTFRKVLSGARTATISGKG